MSGTPYFMAGLVLSVLVGCDSGPAVDKMASAVAKIYAAHLKQGADQEKRG